MSPCTKLVFVTIFLCLKSCGKGGASKLQYFKNEVYTYELLQHLYWGYK